MKLVVVIPAFNEATVIRDVIKSIPKKIKNLEVMGVVVVDDGSSDNTSQVAKDAGAIVLRHRYNLGAGGATLTGMRAARKMDADVLVTLDADGQHDPKEIAGLVIPISENTADVVIGSRLIDATGMPMIKRLVNWFANFVTYIFSGLWVTDSQSGFKAFSKEAIKKIKLNTSGYEFCTEMIRQINVNHLRLKEVPIQAIYTEYSKKKGQPILNSVNVLIRLVINRIIPSA
jgi:glycosyltransferase involved in cell wall biosynthesis